MRPKQQPPLDRRIDNPAASSVWPTAELLIGELRAAPTARTALLAALGRVIGLQRTHGAVALFCDAPLARSSDSEARRARTAVAKAIADILRNAVHEGELPEQAEVSVLATLCMSALTGFGLSTIDERPADHLVAASQLLVNSLGLRPDLSTRRRGKRHPSPSSSSSQKVSA